MSIPFSNVKKFGSLSFISSSHNWPDSQLKALHTKSDRILKNSTLHKLGFPYSPQKISDDILKNAKPIHIKFGEAIMFSLSLIHGQEKNMSFSTRFQSDIRLVNSLAVFEKNRSSESEYYEELINTAITINAKKFIKINNI